MKNLYRALVGTGLSIVLTGLLISCATMTPKRDDPLIGKILNSGNGREVSYSQLLEQATQAEVIYLGENHDNADHHKIQLKMIQDLVDAGKSPQLGFEFFSIEQTGYLNAYIRGHSRHARKLPEEMREQKLRRELGWQDRPDRTWQFYFRFIQLAREKKLTAFGADLPAGTVRSISRNGIDGLSPVEKSLLKPTGFENGAYKKLMFEKFKAAHCGFAMKEHQEKMYQTWIARNDTMSRSIAAMIEASPKQPVVVILGGGHTQHNMGVMERTGHLLPGIRQLNIGLTEIFFQEAPLEAYLRRETVDGQRFLPSHEYLWFTQRSSYTDPCKRFRKHLEAMKKAHKP